MERELKILIENDCGIMLDVWIKHVGSVDSRIRLSPDEDKQISLISYSALMNSADCVKILMENGCHLIFENENPCLYAIEGGNFDIIMILLHELGIDEEILENLIKRNRVDIIKEAKEKNIEMMFRNYTPKSRVKAEMAELLTDMGVNVEIKRMISDPQTYKAITEASGAISPPKTTLLHSACDNGDLDTVKRCLEEEVDVNVRDDNDETPLYKAAHRGTIPVLLYLLKQPNIDVNAQSKGGRTPIFAACDRALAEPVRHLLAHPGIKPDIRTTNGRTPLHAASKKGKFTLLKLLLGTGVLHPNMQDEAGDTCLHIAAKNENIEAIHLFLDTPGIKFNIRNKGGRAAFDLSPRKFLVPFRQKMDLIVAEARKLKKEQKEERMRQKSEIE